MGVVGDPVSVSPAVSPSTACTAATADRRTRCGASGQTTETPVVITVSAADAFISS
jgi:hypothetical protein